MNWSIHKNRFFLSALICSVLIACGQDNLISSNTTDESGTFSIAMKLSATAQERIARAEVVVSGDGMATMTIGLLIDGNTLSGTVTGIPVGMGRNFTINCYDSSDNLIYTGSSAADINAGQTAIVNISVTSTNTSVPTTDTRSFSGSGNGTTGVITLERGVNTIRVNKPSSGSVSLKLIDANTGEEILFNYIPLMFIEGGGQTSIAKSFVLAKSGEYIINIEGGSGFGDWDILIGEDQISTRVYGSSGIVFEGTGNGTTGIISLGQGAHTVQFDKPSSGSVSLGLIDADTGEEILFNYTPLVFIEGSGQTNITKSFVLTAGGDYLINVEISSASGSWKMTIR